jgi:hypothetical protein
MFELFVTLPDFSLLKEAIVAEMERRTLLQVNAVFKAPDAIETRLACVKGMGGVTSKGRVEIVAYAKQMRAKKRTDRDAGQNFQKTTSI